MYAGSGQWSAAVERHVYMIESKDIDQKRKRRRIVTIITAIIAALTTAVCYLMMVFMAGPGMDIVFYLVLASSALLVIYLVLWTLRINKKYSRIASGLQACFLICLAIGGVAFFTLQGFIFSSARTEDSEVDCIVILGAGIYGEAPSRVLTSRLDAALDYIKTREGVPIIVSGGQGPGETISEAEAMFRYLSRRGVDKSLIWKEESSTSTQENIAFSLEIMKANGLDTDNIKVGVVTNEFHLYRAKLIAGELGLSAVSIAAKTPYLHLRILYHCREAFALAKDIFLA